MFVVERSDFALFLLRSAVLGIFLALFYLFEGFFRNVFSKKKHPKLRLVFFIFPDILFCLIVAFLNILLIFAANRGQVRIIALLFELAGFWGCISLLKRRMDLFQKRILRIVKKRIVSPIVSLIGSFLRRVWVFGKRRAEAAHIKRFNKKMDRVLEEYVVKSIVEGAEQLFADNAS